MQREFIFNFVVDPIRHGYDLTSRLYFDVYSRSDLLQFVGRDCTCQTVHCPFDIANSVDLILGSGDQEVAVVLHVRIAMNNSF